MEERLPESNEVKRRRSWIWAALCLVAFGALLGTRDLLPASWERAVAGAVAFALLFAAIQWLGRRKS